MAGLTAVLAVEGFFKETEGFVIDGNEGQRRSWTVYIPRHPWLEERKPSAREAFMSDISPVTRCLRAVFGGGRTAFGRSQDVNGDHFCLFIVAGSTSSKLSPSCLSRYRLAVVSTSVYADRLFSEEARCTVVLVVSRAHQSPLSCRHGTVNQD